MLQSGRSIFKPRIKAPSIDAVSYSINVLEASQIIIISLNAIQIHRAARHHLQVKARTPEPLPSDICEGARPVFDGLSGDRHRSCRQERRHVEPRIN